MFFVGRKKPDNAGGIAASVIVVLLLIATLTALLVYYLRTRPGAGAGLSPTPPSSDTAGFSNEIYEPEPAVSSSDSRAFDSNHIYPSKNATDSFVYVFIAELCDSSNCGKSSDGCWFQ